MPYQHWYEPVTDDERLRQGDVFTGLAVFQLGEELQVGMEPVPVQEPEHDCWIVATASCDLDARAFRHVLLVPVLPADRANLKIQETAPDSELNKRLEIIRRGLANRRFLLPPHPEFGFPLSMAAWDSLALLPTTYLKGNCTGARLRLRGPFREMFGNWIAARFSAVGPETATLIKPFQKKGVQDAHVLELDDAIDRTGQAP